MAVGVTLLGLIEQAGRSFGRPSTMLSFGYPDILIDEESAEKFAHVPSAGSEAQVQEYHRRPSKVIESYSYFASKDVALTVLDYAKLSEEGGPDARFVQHNLNAVWLPSQQYDLVLDPGTTEHVFHVPNMLQTICNACAVGGYVIHWNPLQMLNHGFYNFSPTFYLDFYLENGFEMASPFYAINAHDDKKIESLANPYERFSVKGEFVNCVIFRKAESRSSLVWPIQAKYKEMLKL